MDTIEIECLGCGKNMVTNKLRSVDDNIICGHCGTNHFLDTDWDGDVEIWYVAGVIE